MMITRSLRTYVRMFIPKESVIFPSQGKLKLFEFTDERIHSLSTLATISLGSSSFLYSYFYLTPFSSTLVAVTGSMLIYSLRNSAARTVKSLSLNREGTHVEIITLAARNNIHMIPIDQLKSWKGAEGFKLAYNKQKFLLDQEGKILNLGLFYAVLRQENIDSSKFIISG